MIINGRVTNVYIGDAGSELTVDAPLGSTSITVQKPQVFNEAGGSLELNGTTHTYTSVNNDTGVISGLAPSTPAAAVLGDSVYVMPRGATKWALVDLDDDDEGTRAMVPFSMYDRLEDGIRDLADEESVWISDDKGYWEVASIGEEIPVVDGSMIDPSTLPPPTASDGLAPTAAPVVTASATIENLFLSWPAVANADPVTYDVYMATATGVTTTPGNLVGSTDATVFDINTTPGEKFVKVVARDADGEGPDSLEASATVLSPVDVAGLQAQIDANETAVNARPRVIFATTQPTGLLATERVTWYDTDNGYAASYWDGTAWGPYSLGTGAIASGAVTTALIAPLAVTAAQVAASAITTAKIAADAVTAAEIAASAVGSSEVAAGAIIAGKIAALTIVAGDIASGAITTAKIAALAVTAGEIAAGAIITAKLAAGAVTAATIAADTITAAQIAAGAIAASELAAGSVVAGKIAAGTIVAADIAADTITAAQIGALAITTSELAAGAVTAIKITAGTITANEIAGSTITAAKIAAGTITATQIASGTITAAQIAAGTITTTQLTATAIDGMTITGAVVRTAASSTRVEVRNAANPFEANQQWGMVQFYNSDTLWYPGQIWGQYAAGTPNVGTLSITSPFLNSLGSGVAARIAMTSKSDGTNAMDLTAGSMSFTASTFAYYSSAGSVDLNLLNTNTMTVKQGAGSGQGLNIAVGAIGIVTLKSRITTGNQPRLEVDGRGVDIRTNTLGMDVYGGRLRIDSGGLFVTAGGMSITGISDLSGKVNVLGSNIEVSGAGQTVIIGAPPTGGSANVNWNSVNGNIRQISSTKRHKKFIKKFEFDLEAAYGLRPRIYKRRDWVAEEGDPEFEVGFIAEEAEALGLTNWVMYGPDGKVWSFDYYRWVVALQAMARDSHDKHVKAEQRLASAEQRLDRLEKLLATK